MSDSSISIKAQALVDSAAELRKFNNAMTTDLTDIKKSIDSLKSTWQSTAGEEIVNAMNALSPRFEEYKGIVEKYAQFLVDTANSYRSHETAVTSNASKFRQV